MGYGNWRRGFPGLFFKKKEGNVLLEPSAPLVYKIIMVMFLVLYFFMEIQMIENLLLAGYYMVIFSKVLSVSLVSLF